MPKTVLIIEDEPTLKLIYKEAFKEAAFQILWAGDGFTALEILKRTPVDLVLTDLHLPLVGGEAILSHLGLYHPTLPILVVTGHPEERDAEEETGADIRAVFEKPVDLPALRKAITAILEP